MDLTFLVISYQRKRRKTDFDATEGFFDAKKVALATKKRNKMIKR
jgi:hypothetical protein